MLVNSENVVDGGGDDKCFLFSSSKVISVAMLEALLILVLPLLKRRHISVDEAVIVSEMVDARRCSWSW